MLLGALAQILYSPPFCNNLFFQSVLLSVDNIFSKSFSETNQDLFITSFSNCTLAHPEYPKKKRISVFLISFCCNRFFNASKLPPQ